MVVENDKRRKDILNITIDKNLDSTTTNLLNCLWKYVNDIRLHVLRINNNHIFKTTNIFFLEKLDNYHQSLDLLHVGDNSRFDVFIKSIQLELILKTDFLMMKNCTWLLS